MQHLNIKDINQGSTLIASDVKKWFTLNSVHKEACSASPKFNTVKVPICQDGLPWNVEIYLVSLMGLLCQRDNWQFIKVIIKL